jgi:long-chain acyl-CoA synthetase
MKSLIDLSKENVRTYIGRKALETGKGFRGETWGYDQLGHNIKSAVHYFHFKHGLKSGDRPAFIQKGNLTEKPLFMSTWPLKRSVQIVRNFVQKSFLFPLHEALARPFTVVGGEQLKQLRSPALFVANHCSHVDTVSISRALFPYLKGRLAIAAAADYFYRNKIFGALASLFVNTFPLARKGAVRKSLEHCSDLLENGWSVLMYPEGTRSPEGKLLPFKKGPGLVATALGIPVVPIAILGSHQILPKGNTIPKPGPIQLIIGQPLRVSPNMRPEAAVSMFRQTIEDLLKSMDPKFCERKILEGSNTNIRNQKKVIMPGILGESTSPAILSGRALCE